MRDEKWGKVKNTFKRSKTSYWKVKRDFKLFKRFLSIRYYSLEDRDKLDAFAFRFAKLLEYVNFPTQDKNFLELLKELNKGIIIDLGVG